MAVLVRHHSTGLNAQMYDQSASQLIQQLKQQPGFVYHVAFAEGDGFTVSEIWESQEEHDRWFNAHVKPNVPAEIAVSVLDVHNIVTP